MCELDLSIKTPKRGCKNVHFNQLQFRKCENFMMLQTFGELESSWAFKIRNLVAKKLLK